MMEKPKQLDYVKVNASYSRFNGKVGKVAHVIKEEGLTGYYDVWFADDKKTARFNLSELEKI